MTKQILPVDWRKLLYNIILVLLLPVVLVYLAWRIVVRGKSREGLAERLGSVPAAVRELRKTGDPIIWVQAVSVGEVAAARPILQQLHLAEPAARLVLSTTTPTGRQMAEKLELDLDGLLYFPFDFPVVTERALRGIAPNMLVLVETELWPNLLAAAHRRGVLTAVVNGRISDAGYRKYLRARSLFAWALSHLDLVCAQSEQDAARFVSLGTDPERVVVVGNSKFDENFPHLVPEEAAKWRQDFGFPQEAPVLIAASTHPGEDEIILDAFDRVHSQRPDLQLLIAPRHPHRGDEIEKLITEHGYATCRRSRAQREVDEGSKRSSAPSPEVRVALLDTIGELGRVFSIGTVVFMGGSLVPRGGHNVLEPLAQGKPVIFGPHMHNFRDITDIVLREQAALSVKDLDELVAVTETLLSSETERRLYEVKGPALIAQYSGASARMAKHVAQLLDHGSSQHGPGR